MGAERFSIAIIFYPDPSVVHFQYTNAIGHKMDLELNHLISIWRQTSIDFKSIHSSARNGNGHVMVQHHSVPTIESRRRDKVLDS